MITTVNDNITVVAPNSRTVTVPMDKLRNARTILAYVQQGLRIGAVGSDLLDAIDLLASRIGLDLSNYQLSRGGGLGHQQYYLKQKGEDK